MKKFYLLLTLCALSYTITFAQSNDFQFAAPQGVYAGSANNFLGIATADFDGDGRADVVGILQDVNAFCLFKNNSTGHVASFNARVDYPLAGKPVSIITGDVNLDGKPDVVVQTWQQDGIAVFWNTSSNGVISFSQRVDYFMPVFQFSSYQNKHLTIGDFNSDGLPDIVAVNGTEPGVYVFQNGGGSTINFLPYQAFATQISSSFAVVAQNFDTDQKLDLFIINTLGYLLNLKNQSGGNQILNIQFTQGTPFMAQTGSPRGMIAADFNQDSKPELAVITHTKQLEVYKNITTTGTPAFAAPVLLQVDNTVTHLNEADFDMDGKKDMLIISNPSSGGVVSLFKNTGTGGNIGFAAKQDISFAYSAQQAAIADYNNDKKADIIVIDGSANFYVLSNLTSPSVTPNVPVITSFFPTSGPVWSSVTIKGKHFGNTASGNTVYFGAMKATITSASDTLLTVAVPAGTTYEPITVTNSAGLKAYSDQRFIITFPGAMDSLVATAAFGERVMFTGDSIMLDMAMGDLDGDSMTDIATTAFGGGMVSIYRNTSSNGVISFAAGLKFPDAKVRSLAIEDINGDGKPDIIVSGLANYVTIFRNTSTWGNLSFQPHYIIAGRSTNEIAVRDLDGDGRPDLVMESYSSNGLIVMRNTSEGGGISFGPDDFYTLGEFYPRGLTLEDMDQDGKPDICSDAYISTLDSLYIFRNTSTPGIITFAAKQGFKRGGRGSYDIKAGDLDADNRADLVVGSWATSISLSVLANNSSMGNIALNDPIRLVTENGPQDLALGDIDGDGKPDIAAGNAFANTLSIMGNKSVPGTISFKGTSFMNGGTFPRGISLGDIDGDGKPDLALYSYRVDSISIFRNKTGEALVIPSGSNPVTGGLFNKVTVDPTIQTYQGHPYVQRHYDVTPANNILTATATLTLFFTQQEFDNYNAHPAHGLDLPHHATDDLNKANLRVYQYHGFSTTSLPGSYSGNGMEIDPDDAKIVWNATTFQWEITFDINGFSGFFMGSAGNSLLPVTIVSFEGKVRDHVAMLKWKTTREINVSHFELQRRDNGSEFITIGKINASNGSDLEYDYHYNDDLGSSAVYYYRLKIVDIDQSVTYSKTVIVRPDAVKALITLGPNPAKDFVVVKHPSIRNAVQLRVVDVSGKVIKAVSVGNNTLQTKIMLTGVPKGTYTIVWDEGASSVSQVLIVQ